MSDFHPGFTRKLLDLTLGSFALLSCSVAGAKTVEVSPGGTISSLAGARDAVRALRADGYSGRINVRFAAGIYPITEPVVFEPRDGGTQNAPVVYEAAGGPVWISGGKRIGGWRIAPNGLWTTKIDRSWRFEAFWVNGTRAVRARTPNVNAHGIQTDYVFARAQPSGTLPGLQPRGDVQGSVICISPSDARAFATLTSPELREVQMISFHSWDAVRHRLAGVDAGAGVIQTTGGQGWPFFKPLTDSPQRLYFENYRAALDAPGEWFLALDGTLLYKPRPGETLAGSEFFAGIAHQWMTIRGDFKNGHEVDYLSFRNLGFAYQAYTLPELGEFNGQAQAPLGAAIEMEGANHIAFENCEFTHTMTYALWVGRGCRDITVDHCWIHELGAGGIKIGHADVKGAGPDQTERVNVENTIIQSGGRYFASGVGILIFSANHCIVRRCDISDLFYSAISLGWTWGYAPTSAGHNLVEACHLHHLGWGVLSDMGGIYTLGSQPGTVIRECRVHDIGVAETAGFGLYNDEGSADVRWENNVVYRVQSSGYHLHYGQRNIVRNNIFAFARDFQLRRSRPEHLPAFNFQNNIVVFREGELLGPENGPNWSDGNFHADHNLYWKTGGRPFDFAGKTFQQWQAAGNDNHSLIADPAFANPDSDDFRPRPNSPATKIGFVSFDQTKAGVTGDEAWRRIAAKKYPNMIFPHPREMTSDRQDYRKLPRGSTPAELHLLNGGKADGLQIVHGTDVAKNGLLFTDGPDARPNWTPHIFYVREPVEGAVRIVFEFIPDAKMHLLVEGRDAHEPYRTGPRLDFNQGILFVNGREMWRYLPNTSIKAELSMRLGPSANGSYDLLLTLKNGEQMRLNGLRFDSPEFRELRWFGFICPDESPASFLLKEVEFRVEGR